MKKQFNLLVILFFSGILSGQLDAVDRGCGCNTTTTNNVVSSQSKESTETVGADCKPGCPSRTIFIPRHQTTDAMNELALNNYEIYHHTPCPEDRAFFHFQPSYFHKRSTNECDLGRYFLPNHKNQITVAENGTGDIWFFMAWCYSSRNW